VLLVLDCDAPLLHRLLQISIWKNLNILHILSHRPAEKPYPVEKM
jgi:hypothetical protein